MPNSRRRQTAESAAFYAALAAEMRAALGRANVQQKDIAAKLDYRRPNYLSKRFNGDVPWKLDEVIAVCEYLSAYGPVRVRWTEVVDTAWRNARGSTQGDANDVAK